MNSPVSFQFGENWEDYSRLVGPEQLGAAEAELRRLLPELSMWYPREPPRFVDVGCGSGVHAIVAAQLGANVQAIDVDPVSVRTARSLMNRFGSGLTVDAVRRSILEDLSREVGTFDFVYSWGVLHHTGNVWLALENAAKLLRPAPTSRLALALYRPTRLDLFWRAEKRAYTRASASTRRIVERVATTLWDTLRLAKGITPSRYRSEYSGRRGMSYDHDVRDWLGGYPYETVARDDLVRFMSDRGLVLEREFVKAQSRVPLGIAGSGCDEFVFRWTE